MAGFTISGHKISNNVMNDFCKGDLNAVYFYIHINLYLISNYESKL